MSNKANAAIAVGVGIAAALFFVGIVKIFTGIDNQSAAEKYVQAGYVAHDNQVKAYGICRELSQFSELPNYELFYYRCVDVVNVRLNAKPTK